MTTRTWWILVRRELPTNRLVNSGCKPKETKREADELAELLRSDLVEYVVIPVREEEI